MLDMYERSHSDPNGKNRRKSWKWILIDSLIIGSIAVVASMPTAIPTLVEAWVMSKAFIAAFVFQLAIERGIKKKE